MKTIHLDPQQVAYDKDTDILFASLGMHDLTCLDHEDELDGGVFLQYAWPSRELAGIEVWDFSKRYGSLPTTLHIRGTREFDIFIPCADYALI